MNPLRSRFSVTLVINFLFVTAISLGTASVLNHQVTRRELIRQTQVNLHNESRELALLVGEVVLEHIELLEALSIDGVIRDRLLAIDQTYTDEDAGDIVTRLQQRDQVWANAPDHDPLVQGILRNPVTHELEEFSKVFPDYSDLLITDQYGALVAATHHVDDYYQGDETWWQTVWNNGQGAIYVSQPMFDQALEVYIVEIAVPVYQEGTVVGVVHGFYRLDHVLEEVLESVEFETGGSRLYIDENQFLDHDKIRDDVPFPSGLTFALSETESDEIEYEVFGPEGPVNYGEEAAFVSAEPVHTVTATTGIEGELVDRAIANLNWSILVYQSSAEALHPLTASARVAMVTAAGALILAIALGTVLAQIVSNPVNILINTAKKIEQDEVDAEDLKKLEKLADKRDDMGELAKVFRDMSQVIIEREKSLANEIASLQAQVEAGSQQASGLELAYYEALRKKSAWLRQSPSSKTTINSDELANKG